MSELHYGKNVEWFLRELSAHEAGDIESAEIEVIGENDQGVEGFTTIDITLLAADAVSVISALQQKLDAANDEAAHERNRRCKFETDCKLVQQKLDAVLAENVALKAFPCQLLKFLRTLGTSAIGSQTYAKIETAVSKIKTPATDAILNEVRAEAELEGMVRGAGRVALDASRVYRDAPTRSEERSLHKRIGNFAHMIARRIRAEGANHD